MIETIIFGLFIFGICYGYSRKDDFKQHLENKRIEKFKKEKK